MKEPKQASQSVPAQQTEDKLRALGAAPAKKEDPLASAKASFNAALAKTKAQEAAESPDDDKVVILEQPKKVAQAKPKAEVVEAKPDHSSEIAELRAQLAEIKAAKAEKPAPEKAPEPQTSDYEQIQSQLEEEFGEEEGAVLGKALRALLQPREDRIDRMEKMLNKAIEKSRATSSKDNQARLKANYAQLENKEAWEVVKDRVESIFAKTPDKYETQAEAYDAVAKAIYGEPSAEADDSEAAELEASRIAASLPTPPKTARSEPKVTGVQRSRAIFDHLFKNPEDIAGAKKISRKLQVEE